MKIFKARLKRYFHCLFKLHRSVNFEAWSHGFNDDLIAVKEQEEHMIGCECGRIFYQLKDRPYSWYERHFRRKNGT